MSADKRNGLLTRAARSRTWPLLLLALTTISCSGDSPIEPTLDLPSQMRLEATAVGRVGETNVDCVIDWTMNVSRDVSGDGTVYTGSFGGDIRRTLLDDTGAGIEFWATAHADVHVMERSSGDLELVSFREGQPLPTVTDSRFWEGVRIFRGRRGTGEALVEGVWSCRPMDARGDDAAEVTGTWRLVAVSPM